MIARSVKVVAYGAKRLYVALKALNLLRDHHKTSFKGLSTLPLTNKTNC